MSELSKIEVKVACVFPNLSTYTLPMVSKNKKTGAWETLLEDGSILPRTLTAQDEKEGKRAVRIVLALEEKILITDLANPQAKQPAVRCYTKIAYVHEDHESEIFHTDDRIKNRMQRTIHAFLATHSNAEVHDIKGSNTNKNLQTPLVIVIDETNETRSKKAQNDLITQCREIADALFKTDEKNFIDFCYSLNLPNIHISTPESLYNKMIDHIMANPVWFKEVYDSGQKSLMAMINRAIYQPLSSGETALEFKAGYYSLDGLALVKNKEELLDYFNSNPEALKRLEQKMGVFIPRNTPQKLAEPVPPPEIVKDNTGKTKSVIEQQRHESEIKQKVYNMVTNLKSKQNIQKEDWESYMKKVKLLQEENPEIAKYIAKQADILPEARGLVNPFKSILAQ